MSNAPGLTDLTATIQPAAGSPQQHAHATASSTDTAMLQGSTLAPSMAALIGWRAVQGAATGAAVMCARAIVLDL